MLRQAGRQLRALYPQLQYVAAHAIHTTPATADLRDFLDAEPEIVDDEEVAPSYGEQPEH
jgi:hypothetical protein